MEDVSTLVARQYEAFAYPAPFVDIAEEIGRVAEGAFPRTNSSVQKQECRAA